MNLFQHIVASHIETSHFICSANRMTGFSMKCNTGLKWVNQSKKNGKAKLYKVKVKVFLIFAIFQVRTNENNTESEKDLLVKYNENRLYLILYVLFGSRF